MGKKAAVVIGVDRTGPLPPLKSASDGALGVAAWLASEGFKVNCLTDKAGPVDSLQVENSIAEFVTNPPRYSLLVIYFLGHGYGMRAPTAGC